MTRGRYIVIEGPEGVGKTAQVQELIRRLQAAGLPVRVLREPDSQSDLTARAIRQITQDPRYPMNTRTEVLLYNAARAQSLQVVKQSVEQGVICVVDRNFLTTLTIQYYGRGDVPEYDTINSIINFAVGDVNPDLCVILDAPASVLKQRLEGRYTGDRFDNLDEGFLERVRAGYLWEAKQRNLPVVYSTEDFDTVADNIWKLVSANLALRDDSKAPLTDSAVSIGEIIEQRQLAVPVEPPLAEALPITAPQAETSETSEPQALVSKSSDGAYHITEAGRDYLRDAVTNLDGNVYAFTGKRLNPATVAAAMARLSRRGDDMRVTILDEFANQADKDDQLLRRIITAYGDDSVQQLGGLHLVVENASCLLMKELEWGRLSAYLEQSTRYIYFDQKNSGGKYRYYVPQNLRPTVRKQYCEAMDTLFELYSTMVHRLTDHLTASSKTPEAERDGAWRMAIRAQACDAIRGVLPIATTATVGIYSSGQGLENLIMRLLASDLPEVREAGESILAEGRKVIPMFLERADKPDRGGAMVAYRAQTRKAVDTLAKEYLAESYAPGENTPVTLVDYWPKNEQLLVADMLYEHSGLPLEQIQSLVSDWPYNRKTEVFKAYMGDRLNRRQRPGRALEKAHYSWDLMCEYAAFKDLQRHRLVDDQAWQLLTPRYGYDTPDLVEEAGLSEQFDMCFDISLKLYSLLQQQGYGLEAQYATLHGHIMRWKVTYNAREAFHIHELRTSPQGHPAYRKLVNQMHEKLAEVHPMLAEAMQFVNTDEDPELTRLAAERYSQFKLEQLDKKK